MEGDSTMPKTATDFLNESIEEARREWRENAKVKWVEEPHEGILSLPINKRGTVGEGFVVKLLEEIGVPNIDWHRSKDTQGDLPYDITAGDDFHHIEVKTATIGSDGRSFQHERITKTGFDLLIFVDITPDEIYVTAIPKNFLNYPDMHHRHPSGDYKYDLTLNQLQSGEVKKGCKPPHWNNCRRIETLADFLQIYESAVARLRRRGR